MRETFRLSALPRALREMTGQKVSYQKLYRMIIDGDLQASQLPNGRWLVNRTDVEVIAAQLTRGT